MSAATAFLGGGATLGFLLSALFFLRFWTHTHDSLFAAFGAAFFLLALHQIVIALVPIGHGYEIWIYLLKLAAFALLIMAIVRKNFEPPRDRSP
ncbi:MAG TPA: DUF5985 family protein [Rhizomicrobium sp.]|nr:DUF5985 family protein [Rhizomicrobium sp.]